MYQCFYESVEVSGKDSLSNDHMGVFITSAESVLKDYQDRVKERLDDAQEREDGEKKSVRMSNSPSKTIRLSSPT